MKPTTFDLTGKSALITGAARGIGLAIAQILAANGAAVAIQDIDLAVAESEAAAINAAGGKATALGGDMSDLSILPGLVEQTIAAYGGIQILVNNAGIQIEERWTTIAADSVLRQWTANILAPLRLSQLCYDHFFQQKFGRIINVSSLQARKGNPHMLAYSMSKAALNNLTSGLGGDHELARSGITVNGIAPGWFDTYRNAENLATPEKKVESGKRVPVGRLGQPQDCAGVVLMLCSDAGSYISGDTISVAGGW